MTERFFFFIFDEMPPFSTQILWISILFRYFYASSNTKKHYAIYRLPENTEEKAV